MEPLRALYPDLNEKELHEAQANLGRYIEFVLRLYVRIESDPALHARFKALLDSAGTLQ